MSMVELLVPIAVFALMAVIVSLITRLIATGMLNRTIREALRNDPASVPLLAQRLEARQPWADALLGWVLLALAAAIVLLGLTEADGAQGREMLRAAIVPAVMGATVLLYTRYAARNAPKA
jgi:uncharacterized membrane protein YeaQ/YmgE (transglycosylase-associated protein family)